MSGMPLRVIVHDPETGDLVARDFMDDYMIVAVGTCSYTTEVRADGTHVITVTGRKEPDHG